MSTIQLVLNLVGVIASSMMLGRALSLYYKNYRYKLVSISITTLTAHITLAVAFYPERSVVWLIVPFTILCISSIAFLLRPGIGGIPRIYKLPYLLINIVTALSSVVIN